MMDINISNLQVKKWTENFSLLAKLSGCELSLLKTEKNHQSLIVSSALLAVQEEVYDTCQMLAREVFARGEPLSGEGISGIPESIIGFPVKWYNQFTYGVLIVSSDKEPISQQTMILAENLVSQLDKDISNIVSDTHKKKLADNPATSPEYFPVDFQAFIDSFDDHIWVKDKNGIYIYCNKPAYSSWQIDLNNVIGKNDYDLFDKEIAEKFLATDERVISLQKQQVIEECADINNPGSDTWLETIKVPYIGQKGELLGTIGMTRNVTNRKLIEDQLMIAGTVFENSVEGVIITDHQGHMVYVNQAFCDITGYSQNEVIGRNPKLLKSGRHDQTFYDEMWRALIEEGRWQGEIWNRRKDGAIYPELTTISVVYDDKGKPSNYVAVFVDISLEKQREAELTHMAYHDPLTDLPNRLKLSAQIEHEIFHVKRHGGRLVTIFVDIDHFKHINDTYGHLVGDEVLCEVAERFRNRIREEDTVARIGGDEFVILASGLKDIDSVTVLVKKLISVFNESVELSVGEKHRLTSSMGVAIYPDDGTDSDTLLRNADAAMYRAKQNGRNNYVFYTQSLTEESEAHLKLQDAMHNALESSDEFFLVYQPQFNIQENKLTGVEALIRWEAPGRGLIPPSDFIPVAENTTLIHEIGQWVLFNACSQGVSWLSQGYRFGRIAINVAGPQLQRHDFADSVEKILEITGLPAACLELEVTESVMMDQSGHVVDQLHKLRALGIEIAIDDFGTGYSSLSYLHNLPVDKMKIDRSFVMNIPGDKNSIAIANTIILLAKSLSMKVLAEGVETQEQLDTLGLHGCSEVQGFLLGKPVLPEEIVTFFEKD